MIENLRLPSTPFRSDAIAELGITRTQLRRLVSEGTVRRVFRNVYVAADAEDTVELRSTALRLVAPPTHVIRDRTAAWLHHIDTLTYAEHHALPPVETCALRGSKASGRAGVDGRTRDLAKVDVMRIHGLLVTTPLRTALDLGCILRRREALAALDAFCRVHGITQQELVVEAKRYTRRRGVVQLRELIGLVDPRAESARESWTRLEIHDAGLPSPTPQFWIVVDGRPTYRLDLAYPRQRVAVEYDGWAAHEQTPDQIARDAARRQWLSNHGWTVIVVKSGDFSPVGLARWLGELRHALRSSYSNVRDLERGSRSRRHALANDQEGQLNPPGRSNQATTRVESIGHGG